MASKTEELRELNDAQLVQRLLETKEEHFNLRFQNVTGQLENHARLGELRKDIARLNTEPMPVTMPHAIRHAEVSGTSLSIGTACTSFTTVISANDDVAAKLPAGSPPTVKISRRLPSVLRHQVGLPTAHWSQMPQLETVAITTWSPGFTRVTWSPTASTMPAPSWPPQSG